MAYGSLYQDGESSEVERSSRTPGAACGIARGHAGPFRCVRVVITPSISISGGGFWSRSTSRSCRSYGADHVEASAAYRRTAAEVCQKQRIDDGRDRDGGTRSDPEHKEEAWLSRARKAACSKSTLTMFLIACSSRSSSRPTIFWCPLGSAPWGV